jgi:hypothetical protein
MWEDCVLYVFGFAGIDDREYGECGLLVFQVPLKAMCFWGVFP